MDDATPAPAPAPERRPYLVLKAVHFEGPGNILLMTPEQAASAGDSVRPATDQEVAWGLPAREV